MKKYVVHLLYRDGDKEYIETAIAHLEDEATPKSVVDYFWNEPHDDAVMTAEGDNGWFIHCEGYPACKIHSITEIESEDDLKILNKYGVH